jgi:hypothetical protein
VRPCVDGCASRGSSRDTADTVTGQLRQELLERDVAAMHKWLFTPLNEQYTGINFLMLLKTGLLF